VPSGHRIGHRTAACRGLPRVTTVQLGALARPGTRDLRRLDERSNGRRCFPVHRRCDVAVGVEGDADLRVTQTLLDHLWVDAGLQRKGRPGMPQAVD